jgi:phage terminase large subunit-like protein
MPRGRKTVEPVDLSSVLDSFNERLRAKADRPDLYAYKPHDKQYLFHSSTAKVILYIGGNRSGKTTGGAVETCYRLMGRHPYKKIPPAPIRGRAVSVDFLNGVDKIMLPEIARWMPPSFLQNGSWEDSYDKEHKTLTLANKSFIEFRSYEQDLDKFAGTSRHFMWFDEEPPKDVYNECGARLIDTDGDAFITMTPVNGMSWVYDDIYQAASEGLRDDILVIEIEMTENPYLGKAAAERYLSTLTREERKARERGEFVAMGGTIFRAFSRYDHVIPVVENPAEVFHDWQWFCSFDHGYNNPTAILWHAVSKNDDIVTFSEHYESEMTVDQHAQVYHARNLGFKRVPDINIGDPAMGQRNGVTGTSIIQEYADHGIYIGGERSDVDSGINRMIQYLNPDRPGGAKWKITENCTNLIQEMRKYRWATFSSSKVAYQKNKQEKPNKKDDHAIDSTRYMFTMMPDLTPVTNEKTKTDPGNALGATTASPIAGSWDEVLSRQISAKPGVQWNSGEPVSTEWDVSDDIKSLYS